MNIHEVLEYGPIVAHDEELDLLITVNGAYFNLWVGDTAGNYDNTEAYDVASRITTTEAERQAYRGLYGMDIARVIDKAEEQLAEIILAEGEEEE